MSSSRHRQRYLPQPLQKLLTEEVFCNDLNLTPPESSNKPETDNDNSTATTDTPTPPPNKQFKHDDKTTTTHNIYYYKIPGLQEDDLKSHPLLKLSFNRVLNNLRGLLLDENILDDDGSSSSPSKCVTDELITQSLQELNQLEAYVFERLNTGHWKEVSGGWRRVYSAVCLLKLPFQLFSSSPNNNTSNNSSSLLQSAIKTCDNSILMGHPICSDILGTVAEELCSELTNLLPGGEDKKTQPVLLEIQSPLLIPLRNKSNNEFQIKELVRPSMEEFSRLMEGSGTPAKLIGIVDHWPALGKWDVEYFRKIAGPRSVPVEIGSSYTSSTWTQKIMTINEFINQFMTTNPQQPSQTTTGYIAQHNLFTQIKSLSPDIPPPDYIQLSQTNPTSSLEINARFGPPNTISPTHHDPNHNILVQVFGAKAIRLFPPEEGGRRLEPFGEGSLLFNTSSLDVEGVGLFEENKAIREVSHCDLFLESGEAVFIPRGWWHYVKSLSCSCSVSFWFE